jgi:hypothetical protein
MILKYFLSSLCCCNATSVNSSAVKNVKIYFNSKNYFLIISKPCQQNCLVNSLVFMVGSPWRRRIQHSIITNLLPSFKETYLLFIIKIIIKTNNKQVYANMNFDAISTKINNRIVESLSISGNGNFSIMLAATGWNIALCLCIFQ